MAGGGRELSWARKFKSRADLAATVSRVHDPLMRGEVVNKASARLGVLPRISDHFWQSARVNCFLGGAHHLGCSGGASAAA